MTWPCPHEKARAVCPDCGATVSAASSVSAGATVRKCSTECWQTGHCDGSCGVSAEAGQVPADITEKALEETVAHLRLLAGPHAETDPVTAAVLAQAEAALAALRTPEEQT